jgi:hypothetical protein
VELSWRRSIADMVKRSLVVWERRAAFPNQA